MANFCSTEIACEISCCQFPWLLDSLAVELSLPQRLNFPENRISLVPEQCHVTPGICGNTVDGAATLRSSCAPVSTHHNSRGCSTTGRSLPPSPCGHSVISCAAAQQAFFCASHLASPAPLLWSPGFTTCWACRPSMRPVSRLACTAMPSSSQAGPCCLF